MSEKRHLPVLQPRPPEDEEERPPWHWAGIGAVATLLAWLPLAMLAESAVKTMFEPFTGDVATQPSRREWLFVGIAALALRLGPLALAALLGGLLVGRFGGAAGKKEATVAGIAAVTVALVVTLFMGTFGGALGWLLAAAVLLVLAGVCARAGAAIGLRLRR